MDVGQNGRPRGPQMLVWFSINHPMIGVPNFDPLGQTNVYPVAWLVKKNILDARDARNTPQNILLVGGFNHLEKYESQWEGLFPYIMEK